MKLYCNAILGGIRTDEQQKKIEELEELFMKENEKSRSCWGGFFADILPRLPTKTQEVSSNYQEDYKL